MKTVRLIMVLFNIVFFVKLSQYQSEMGSAGSKRRAERDADGLIQTLDDHESGINCMALSSDSTVLATGSDDHNIRLWSTKATPIECLSVLSGHADYITYIVMHKNYLISASADQTMRKWDMTTGKCMFVCTGHTSLVYRIACIGDFLLSTSYDRTARCWDFYTGDCIRVFIGHSHGILPILFISSNQDSMENDFENEMNIYTKDIVITGSQDTTAKTWSFETGECLKTFEGHIGAVLCLRTDLPGKILFTGSGDGTIRLWSIHRGTELRIYDQHQAAIIDLLVTNKLLYSISADHTARCWVIDVGDCTRIYKGHHHTVSCILVEHGLVFTGCGDAIVRCFEARSGVIKRSFKSHALAINCIQIVDNRLFSGSVDGSLKVWDISDLKGETSQNPKPIVKSKTITTTTTTTTIRVSKDSRSDIQSRIDDREYRERRTLDMV
ncbi:unnamed protein product [Rotaria magnacalcarata]|uniref:WD repeat-containing protein 86 n=2 Tax=Rotaria magnacalcarata TaxID=392030 RepID=A0A819PHW7_9BILA|nr:unnamed protein product [Rotaria magnacalcarata]